MITVGIVEKRELLTLPKSLLAMLKLTLTRLSVFVNNTGSWHQIMKIPRCVWYTTSHPELGQSELCVCTLYGLINRQYCQLAAVFFMLCHLFVKIAMTSACNKGGWWPNLCRTAKKNRSSLSGLTGQHTGSIERWEIEQNEVIPSMVELNISAYFRYCRRFRYGALMDSENVIN